MRADFHSGALGEDGARGGPVLSYSLKCTQTGLEFSVGRFVTAQRPTYVRSNFVVVPYSFAITRHFPRKVFPKLNKFSVLLSQNLFGSLVPSCLEQPSAITWPCCFAAEIDLCLESNGGCHTHAECIKTGPKKVSVWGGCQGNVIMEVVTLSLKTVLFIAVPYFVLTPFHAEKVPWKSMKTLLFP